jgi:hypothetical protein
MDEQARPIVREVKTIAKQEIIAHRLAVVCDTIGAVAAFASAVAVQGSQTPPQHLPARRYDLFKLIASGPAVQNILFTVKVSHL